MKLNKKTIQYYAQEMAISTAEMYIDLIEDSHFEDVGMPKEFHDLNLEQHELFQEEYNNFCRGLRDRFNKKKRPFLKSRA
jgi:hypothetical protein